MKLAKSQIWDNICAKLQMNKTNGGIIKMKSIYLNVEFKDPESELKSQLQRGDARNIYVRRQFNGELEVRYIITAANSQKVSESELRSQLQRSYARNIDVRRQFNGELQVSYTIKAANPQKEIESMLTQAGGKNVRSSSSYNGARYDFKIDDIIDERVFKQKIAETLRRAGYRAY